MLAKKTSKNQITLPEAVAVSSSDVEYFDVSTDGATITLRALKESRADEVRTRLARLGIKEADVADAVAWTAEPSL